MAQMSIAGPLLTVSGRRRKLATPEINTYAKQMQQCGRKYAKIPLEKGWDGITPLQPRALLSRQTPLAKFLPLVDVSQGWTSPTSPYLRRDSRRRSSQFVMHHKRKSSEVQHRRISNGSQHRRRSSVRDLYKISIPLSPEKVSREQQGTPETRKRSNDYSNGQRNPSIAHRSHVSRRTSVVDSLPATLKFDKHARADGRRQNHRSDPTSLPAIGAVGNNRKSPKSFNLISPGHGQSVSPPTVTVTSFSEQDQQHLLRALTTLAINSLTTTSATPEDTIGHIGNISCLGRRISPFPPPNFANQTVTEHRNSHEKDYMSSNDGSSWSDHGFLHADGNEALLEDNGCVSNDVSSARYNINKLMDYLQRCGQGQPTVLISPVTEAARNNLYLSKVLARMGRGLSQRALERLRVRARLDYDVCRMKAKSFCEQHEQVYMRTASADLGDRDLRMLEEDLKRQALQDIRATRLNSRQQETKHRTTDSINPQNGGRHNDINGNGEKNMESEDHFGNPDSDGMSDLMRCPLGRREMTQRILAWVADVELATQRNQAKERGTPGAKQV